MLSAPLSELLLGLQDPDFNKRIRAARVLGKRRIKAATPALVNLLQDQVQDVREVAAIALGRLGDTRAITPLAQALGSTQSGQVREAAYSRLIKFGAPAIPALIHIAQEHDQAGIKALATTALGEIGGADVLEPLLSMLQQPEALVRQRAVAALGQLHDPRAVTALITALEDTDFDTQRIAVQTLGQSGDVKAITPLLNRLHRWDLQTVPALQQLGYPQLADTLAELMDDMTHPESFRVPLLLAYLGDERARVPLLKALTQPDINARRPVVQGLDRLNWIARGEPEPRPPDNLLLELWKRLQLTNQ